MRGGTLPGSRPLGNELLSGRLLGGALLVLILLLCSSAFGQSYEMTVELSSGETVTIALDDIDFIMFLDVPSDDDPVACELLQNYPNPFSASTTIAYEISDETGITVRIYNVQGALVRELTNRVQSAGDHEVAWDGTDAAGEYVSCGAYFCAVECDGEIHSKKLILVR